MAGQRLTGKVAIVGAGIAGLAAGQRLKSDGIEAFLFDKGKFPGGRLSTRQQHDRQFDHGAQYMRPHSGRAAVLFSKWRKQGLITPWHAQALELPQRKKVDTTSWHVALPSQNALARHLAKDLKLQCKFQVLDISGERGNWSLIGHKHQSAGPFETVLVTCPAEQTAQLLGPYESLAEVANKSQNRPCLATMVEFEEEVIVDFDAAFVSHSPLAWVCRDSAKPGRPDKECWVLHATEEWSKTHLEKTPEKIASLMLSAFAPLSYAELPPVSFCRSHRWRYAFPTSAPQLTHIFDAELSIGVAGDWCNTPNVDGAYFSGIDLAESYLKSLS